MAKQVGPLFFTGTIDGVIFYKLGDQYYVRSKGDYKSGKQMRRDPRLKRTMQKAEQFGAASKLVKPVYYHYLPKTVRKHGLFGKLTGMVNGWLQEGKCKEEIKEALIAHCRLLATPPTATSATSAEGATTPMLPMQDTSIPAATETQPAKPARRNKQVRYLSSWKVKRNGRLHIPQTVTAVYKPSAGSVWRGGLAYERLFLEKKE